MTSTNASTTVALMPSSAAAGQGARDVVALDFDARAARARWAMQLDAVMREQRSGVIAVADGLAAVALAYWMQLSPRSYLAMVHGAVLRTPAAAAPCAVVGLATLPATRLPVRAIVVGRAGDDAERHLALADRWGARFVPDHQLARSIAADATEQRLLDLARVGVGAVPAVTLTGGQVVSIRAMV